VTARDGLTLASRSCSLLKVDPQVLQRHPVIGVRAAFASLIRDGLNDNPSSPPHCKHKRLGRSPLFSAPESWSRKHPRPRQSRLGRGPQFSLQELNVLGLQAFRAFDHVKLHGLAFLEALEAG
jgi:hypothetical protein